MYFYQFVHMYFYQFVHLESVGQIGRLAYEKNIV